MHDGVIALLGDHIHTIKLVADSLKVYNVPASEHRSKLADYIKPNIDLLIGHVTAFVLVWKYIRQREKELAEKIIESKRQAYNEYLNNFTEIALAITYNEEMNGREQDKARILARNQLLLFANDYVMKVYYLVTCSKLPI